MKNELFIYLLNQAFQLEKKKKSNRTNYYNIQKQLRNMQGLFFYYSKNNNSTLPKM